MLLVDKKRECFTRNGSFLLCFIFALFFFCSLPSIPGRNGHFHPCPNQQVPLLYTLFSLLLLWTEIIKEKNKTKQKFL